MVKNGPEMKVNMVINCFYQILPVAQNCVGANIRDRLEMKPVFNRLS